MIKKIFLSLIIPFIVGLTYFSCRKKMSCDDCVSINKQPVADAGRDTIVVLPPDSIQLDGSKSTDPDGSIKEYLWAIISGPSSGLIVNKHSSRTFAKNLNYGVYQFELIVTDDLGLSVKDTLMITADTVISNSHRPIADAGPDQTIIVPPDFLFDGTVAVLDGSKSADPDHNIFSYQWSKILGAASYSLPTRNIQKTEVTFFDYGYYQFELKVTDSVGLTAMDTININVEQETTKTPRFAYAGPDQVIFLPTNSVTLDGKLYSSSDNGVIVYQWTKISGPSFFIITDPDKVTTQVTSLTEGVYQFELKVTDTAARFSSDTVQVTVRSCGINRPAYAVTPSRFGKLSKPRYGVAIASAANKIVFAGGISPDEKFGSSRVDIYDMVTQKWTIAELSIPRYGITATVCGNKILFAGGVSGELGDVLYMYHSQVDIYDASIGSWSVTSLSEPQSGVAAASVGNKAFFAGGGTWAGNANKVEIFDVETNTWSFKTLSDSRQGISAVTLNNKIYFAGGINTGNSYSNKIDIYDNISNSWSTSTLSDAKIISTGGVAVNNKIFWAGGNDALGSTCKVEITDWGSQAVSFDNLSDAGIVKATLINNKLAFFDSDNDFDIYDITAETWSIGTLPKSFQLFLSVNGTIYAVDADEVWKLEF